MLGNFETGKQSWEDLIGSGLGSESHAVNDPTAATTEVEVCSFRRLQCILFPAQHTEAMTLPARIEILCRIAQELT